MTPEERELLETTARSLLKLEHDVSERLTGIEAVLHALFVTGGNTELALARLRIEADLLRMKGIPSRFLDTFLNQVAGNKTSDSKIDVVEPDTDGSRPAKR